MYVCVCLMNACVFCVCVFRCDCLMNVFVCIYVCVFLYKFICGCVRVCVYVRVCFWVHVCMHVSKRFVVYGSTRCKIFRCEHEMFHENCLSESSRITNKDKIANTGNVLFSFFVFFFMTRVLPWLHNAVSLTPQFTWSHLSLYPPYHPPRPHLTPIPPYLLKYVYFRDGHL